MRPTDDHGDWCERVASAIVDGRFLEDPAFWKPHVETCAVCRERVSGLFALRERIRQASLSAPIVEQMPPQDGVQIIETAFRRFHRGRRIRNTSICVVIALVCGTAALLASRESNPQTLDPVSYARRLNLTVFGEGSTPDYALLKRDVSLRAEYLAALDNPSSLVRRTALSALLLSGVPLETQRLENALTELRESLDTPLELASTSDSARFIAEALAARHVATVRAALKGLQVGAVQGVARIDSAVIVPFLRNADVDVRRSALLALIADPAYSPGSEITRLLYSDPDLDVRLDAAICLAKHLGDRGASLVIERLKATRDDALEERVLPVLAGHPATLAFSQGRMASGALPVGLTLAHEWVLLRSGMRSPPDALIRRVLQEPTAETFLTVAALASEADWLQYRDRLQAVWQGMSKTNRTEGGLQLVRWDLKAAGDERRAQMALDICVADRNLRTRDFVAVLAKSGSATIRGRAQELLDTWTEK